MAPDSFPVRYVFELCFLAVVMLFAVVWYMCSLSRRVGRLESGVSGCATTARLEEISNGIFSELARLRSDDEQIRAQTTEALGAYRALTDQQFSIIGQLTQRMDLYIATELQDARASDKRTSPAPILSPA